MYQFDDHKHPLSIDDHKQTYMQKSKTKLRIKKWQNKNSQRNSPNHAVATEAMEVPTVNTTLCVSNIS